MVEHVKGLNLELDAEALGNIKTLQGCQVNVVNWSQLQGVAPDIGYSTQTSLYILRAGILGGVANDIAFNIDAIAGAACCIGSSVACAQDVAQRAVGTGNNTAAQWDNPCSRATSSCGIQDRSVAGPIAVQVGVQNTLSRYPLPRLVGVNRRDLPIADSILQKAVTILEEGLVIDHRESQTVPMIKDGVRTVGTQVQAILRTPGRQNCAEHLSRCVVNIMAVCVGQYALQAVAKAFGQLCRQAVIRRRSPRLERSDCARKASGFECWYDGTVSCLNVCQRLRRSIHSGLVRRSEERGQVVGSRHLRLLVELNLRWQMDTPGTEVANFKGVVGPEGVLNT